MAVQAPDTDVASMLFTGFYALLGVPLYAMALGSFAGIIVERYERCDSRVHVRVALNAVHRLTPCHVCVCVVVWLCGCVVVWLCVCVAVCVCAPPLLVHSERMENALEHRISEKEFAYANKLGNTDGVISYSEFVEMELLRLGKVDMGLLKQIKARFQYLDILGVNQITMVRGLLRRVVSYNAR